MTDPRLTSPTGGSERLSELFRELGFDDDLLTAHDDTVLRKVGELLEPPLGGERNAPRLPRLALVQERIGLDGYERFLATLADHDATDYTNSFRLAYSAWRALLTPRAGSPPSPTSVRATRPSREGLTTLQQIFPEDPLPPDLSLALHLAVAGTLGGRQAEIRLDLAGFDLLAPSAEGSWLERVARWVVSALALLVRKGEGWRDVGVALQRIAQLRELQGESEESFLLAQGEINAQRSAAAKLVVWYHLAQMTTVVGEYLRDGTPSLERVATALDRHRDRALDLTGAFGMPILAHTCRLIWACSRALASNSIWSHVGTIGERMTAFTRALASPNNSRPVLELWPSQQEALRKNVLSTYHRAILVAMPTSAGKTLLAKFSIIQAKALNPTGVVVYIAPTRALVNQVTIELRQDFRHVGLSVEQTVPAFELDPAEDSLLRGVSDVLITTPEKLDLLVRRDHAVTRDLSLVVVDEAHSLSDATRGARLELLLGMLKRERPNSRFLLLSPFLPEASELTTWLGDDRALAPITVQWEPSNKVVAAALNARHGAGRRLVLETLPSVDNVGVAPGRRVAVGPAAEATTISSLSEATVAAMRRRGSVLVLCRGPGTSETRAADIAASSPERHFDADVDAVCRFLQAEAGADLPLANHLRKGVAFHHAGLSPEARWLIEFLIRQGRIDVICGTTTLGAGVNYPITSVIVETLNKGVARLTRTDFWNIAGRAGRALVDSVGVVAFPTRHAADQSRYVDFLQEEAEEVASQLAGMLGTADDLAEAFTMRLVERHPEFGSFLQFLAHAMRLAGEDDLARDVEDLLRSTLVYRQVQRADPNGTLARKLVAIARSYLAQVRGNRGILGLADQTGFSTPSVLFLQTRVTAIPNARDRGAWQPDALFGLDIGPLRSRIEAVASIPEIQLGVGHRQPFSAGRIAAILRDWVNGADLGSLAARYPLPLAPGDARGTPEDATARFSAYLFGTLIGKASWGLGALEGLCLAGDSTVHVGDETYVPSMIFFGVRRKEAVWLRMVGMPRMLADNLGEMWDAQRGRLPETFGEVRGWINDLQDDDWRRAIPRGSPLTPDAARRVWRAMSGEVS